MFKTFLFSKQNVILSSLLLFIHPLIRRAEAVTSLKFVLICFSSTDERTRLSGMQIKGDGHFIYEDPPPKITWCSSYPPEGMDVCSDVIRIPLNGTSVRKLKMSTYDYLTLCEVQVFGGIEVIFLFQT